MPVFNDQYRLDGYRTASCFSIGHPNYKMFYRLRQENPGARWVVVACNSSVLWQKDCAFCHENAASNSVTCIPLGERKGVEAFERLFLPIEGKPGREELDLPACCPTHPQAEVLIFDTVEPEFLAGVVCQDQASADELAGRHPDFEIVHNLPLFSARKDFQHWK